MTQKRMFSQEIVVSDAFLEMPVSCQALYFHLAMRADDDGFVTPKMVMRLIGSTEDDLKVLKVKRFLLPFESGVVVIKHWLIHNLLRADLYKETLYKKEKSTLGLNANGAYTELRGGVSELQKIQPPEWLLRRRGELRTANVPQTALRLGKDSIDITSNSEQGSQVNEMIDIFYKVNPTIKYGNKTMRASVLNLYKVFGKEKALKMAEYACSILGKEFAPVIATPQDLEKKATSLAAYYQKSQNNGVANFTV